MQTDMAQAVIQEKFSWSKALQSVAVVLTIIVTIGGAFLNFHLKIQKHEIMLLDLQRQLNQTNQASEKRDTSVHEHNKKMEEKMDRIFTELVDVKIQLEKKQNRNN